MSGVKQKNQDSLNRRQARAQQEYKAKKKLRTTTIIIVVVVVLLVAAAVFLNSKMIRRTLTAVTVGGHNFSAAEFDYFYNTSRQEYVEMANSEQYANMLPVPDDSKPLASQIYDSETGKTWSEYFAEYAISRMTELVQFNNEAAKVNYTLSDEDRKSMEDEIESLRGMSELYGFSDFNQFLRQSYGSSINEKVFKKTCELIYIVRSFCADYYNDLTYSDEEIKGYYSENSDTLDVFAFRYITVTMESVNSDDYETDEEYQAAREESLANALVLAEGMAAEIESEEDFIEAARAYNDMSYSDDSSTLREYSGEMLGSVYGPWITESERMYNDVTAIEMSNGAYVVYYIGRSNNDYNLVEMRQLLFKRGEIDPSEYELGMEDPSYNEAFEAADMLAQERGNEALHLLNEGGGTEELLIELMEEHTDDTTEGGFYSNIAKYAYSSDSAQTMELVPEIEEWLFAEGRQVGDYELIFTEAYGYHLVYFTGYGEKFCDFMAKDRLSSADYLEWTGSIAEIESSKTWAFLFTQA